MINIGLHDLAKIVNGTIINNNDTYVSGVSIDSRTITRGNLYIPIIGDRFNGHDFIYDAEKNGAGASFWSLDRIPDVNIPLIKVDDTLNALQTLAKEYRKKINVKVIGITGTNGKTSTKDILGSILSQKYKTQTTKGNLNNHIGVPLTLLSLDRETQFSVVEMGMNNLGEIELLTRIATPDIAVITNVGKGHLENLKTIDNVAKAKLEIIKGLKDDGVLIYNGDDSNLSRHVNKLNIKQSTKTFGQNKENNISFNLINSNINGVEFKVDNEHYHLPMIGKHQVYNATACVLVAKQLDMNYKEIKNGLKNVQVTSMRSELIESNNFYILNDAYNCNPESTKAALESFYSLEGYKQKIIVFADMLELGENEIKLHKEVGNLIDFNQIDYLLTFGDLAKYTANEANGLAYSFDSKEEIIIMLKNIIRNDSIILLKGSRGMKLEEIVESLT